MKNFSKRYSIKIPKDISLSYCENLQVLLIKGILNKRLVNLNLKILVDSSKKLIVVTDTSFNQVSNSKKKTIKSLQGTTASLIKKAILEVSFKLHKKLEITGVGYKSFLINECGLDLIHFKLGYSHDIFLKLPTNIVIELYKTNSLFFSGTNYHELSKISALVRDLKKPEPYKGKGIKYSNEIIKLKEGKKL